MNDQVSKINRHRTLYSMYIQLEEEKNHDEFDRELFTRLVAGNQRPSDSTCLPTRCQRRCGRTQNANPESESNWGVKKSKTSNQAAEASN